jgi:predicted Rossmann-fold nucleotide-binding protein
VHPACVGTRRADARGTWIAAKNSCALSKIPRRLSDAYVVVPGGIGTVLESMLVWQLLQVRHLHDTPLIFVGDMWAELIDWTRRYMRRPGFELANAEDMEIPSCVKSADEAMTILRDRHARWQCEGSGG